jgi:DNA primase
VADALVVIDYAAAAADNDPAEIKASTNLAGVVLSYGIELEPNGDRLWSVCPFHEDDKPSFTVWQWPDGGWGCGCWACEFGPGDLFDFIQRWHGCDFREAVRRAVQLRDGGLPDVPEVAAYYDVEPPDLAGVLELGGESPVVDELLRARGVSVDPHWLRSEFRVVAAGITVMVPHYTRDMHLQGIKLRSRDDDWVPTAVRGSQLTELYGIWRTRDEAEVVVCEGESDTWTVAGAMTDFAVDVVGLPSGVAAHPRREWLEWMDGKNVTLLFDADDAGWKGAARWQMALADHARECRTVTLPAGTDATSAGPVAIWEALS